MHKIRKISELIQLREMFGEPVEIQNAVRDIRNEPDIRSNMYQHQEISANAHSTWLEKVKTDQSLKIFLVFSLDNKLIGALSFSNIDTTNKRADWAFYLSSTVQGRGFGKALEYLALEYAFSNLRLNKLNCEVIDWNTPVLGLHQSFGFVKEGIRRDHVYRDGKFYDVVLLGIRNAEWQKHKALG